MDVNDDGQITWSELLARKDAVCAYALSRLHIQGDGKIATPRVNEFLVDNLSDGAYAVLRFEVEGIHQPRRLEVNYNAFFDIDPKHRGLFRLERDGKTQLGVFSPTTPTLSYDFDAAPPSNPFWTFLKEGIWHIWSGYDHILFLLALLLGPESYCDGDGPLEPVAEPRRAFTNVLKVVTAFTVAHSITLSLSVLGIVHLPTRLIESAIAASVVIAALTIYGRCFPTAFGWPPLDLGCCTDLDLQTPYATSASNPVNWRSPCSDLISASKLASWQSWRFSCRLAFGAGGPCVLSAIHFALWLGCNHCCGLNLARRARPGF